MEFRVKNSDAGMQLNYTLDRKGDKWVVQARQDSGQGHGVVGGEPGAIPSGSGQLPPGHPAIPATPPPIPNPLESETMKTVAVLGGGPAGASAAERLARAGLNTHPVR